MEINPEKPKQIIVKLRDLNTKDKDFKKKFAAVYVQQDRRYVDMLIFNDDNSRCKLVFNPYSKVKFTLKNLKTSENYGHASIVMRLLKDIKGKKLHEIPLNGDTFGEFEKNHGYKPNIEVEYQWNEAKGQKTSNSMAGQGLGSGSAKSTVEGASKELEETTKQIIEMLNEQSEIDSEQNQEFLQYLENTVMGLVESINDENQIIINNSKIAAEIHSNAVDLNNQAEQRDLQEVQELSEEDKKVTTLLNLFDSNIEEAKKRNLDIRKKTGFVATLPAEVKEMRKDNEEKRHKMKTLIDNTITRIVQVESENLKQLDMTSLNQGLHESEEATKMFDEVLKLDGRLVNKNQHDSELIDIKEAYDDKLSELRFIKHEVEVIDNHLSKLDREIQENDQDLQSIIDQRQAKSEENKRLEGLIQDLEEREEIEARNLDKIRQNTEPIKDITLKTTRRIHGSQSRKNAAATLKISVGKDDIHTNNLEMDPNKLSSTLVAKKHQRERARSELGEGESKWKHKVNILYEGVNDLYTPSTKEMDQRAEIHRLMDELKSCRMRTEKLSAILDQLTSERKQIQSENLKVIKEELARRLSPDQAHIQRVMKTIESTKRENAKKQDDLDSEQERIKELTDTFRLLLQKQSKLTNLISEYEQKLKEKDGEETRRHKAYESSIKNTADQSKIDAEIEELRGKIAYLQPQIQNLQQEADDLEYDHMTIVEKTRLKISINKKRKDDEFKKKYIPDPLDALDVKIGEYYNKESTSVPVKKLARNKYMFGRKTIEITQDKKQDGGYSVYIPAEDKQISLQTLLTTYAEEELKTLANIQEDQEMVVGDGDETIRAASPGGRKAEATFG